MTRASAGALLIAAACGSPPPPAGCDDDLRGIYAGADGAWMVLDQRATLEAYPLFADVPVGSAGLEVAPRVIALTRDAAGLAGDVRRRSLRGATACLARASVRVTRCTAAGLELVIGDPPPLLDAAGCAFARPAPARVERWRRQ